MKLHLKRPVSEKRNIFWPMLMGTFFTFFNILDGDVRQHFLSRDANQHLSPLKLHNLQTYKHPLLYQTWPNVTNRKCRQKLALCPRSDPIIINAKRIEGQKWHVSRARRPRRCCRRDADDADNRDRVSLVPLLSSTRTAERRRRDILAAL